MDRSRFKSCLDIFQKSFGFIFSSYNWSESLLKYSAFDFLISFITVFRVFLKFCHTCCTLVRFARLYRRLRLRISLRIRSLIHGYSFGLIVAILFGIDFLLFG